jgi:hypothetical protein
MVALLLIGHWYIGDKPAAPWTLLFELIKLLLLLGCTVTCTLLSSTLAIQAAWQSA